MSGRRLLEVQGLRKHYPQPRERLFGPRPLRKVVDDVSFHLDEGETLGLVGESGSGKSTIGRLILRLLPADGGSVRYGGEELLSLSKRQFQPYRQAMQMVFQDPLSSLNPAYRVSALVEEALRIHRPDLDRRARVQQVEALLHDVGLNSAQAARYPHELSGGQRQRVGIARALAVEAKLIIADEPVSALDVSVQAQILNLLQALKQRHGLSYLFIAHDLAVVRYMSQRVAVMYLGQIVEIAPVDSLYERPAHPYTRLLLGSVAGHAQRLPPVVSPPAGNERGLGAGCRFYARCPYRLPRCAEQAPLLRAQEEGHQVACHLV